MRVVSGTARGRVLKAVPGDTTRPILDRVKTALFDILRPELEGITMLDLFGGSGSVGIEALSQGAAFCYFLDISKNAVETIRENLKTTGFEAKAEVRNTDAFTFLRNTVKSFDLIYVAPPQYKGIWGDVMRFLGERPQLVNDGGLVVVQIDPKEYEDIGLAAFDEEKRKRYGNTELIFYRKPSAHS